MSQNPDRSIRQLLEERYRYYHHPRFIAEDPLSVPHQFTRKADREIAGLFAAVLSWGRRTSILKSCNRLLQHMDFAPHDFVLHHTAADLRRLTGFCHRTFKDTDLYYFLHFLKRYYRKYPSLEDAFARFVSPHDETIENGLIGFHRLFFAAQYPQRTRKHLPTPERGSACKRLNLFLRWMVRRDDQGIDFGIWTRISPRQLVCPCDVHVMRVASRLGLACGAANWKTALTLTARLRELDPDDPVRFDFALFGMGVVERMP
ncbi:MAG: TIGR02757 family protein [Chitinophagales bacterium]|nr:TIGR02757 family protein [Chitinophagales bacterium]MDW8393885.1 TIGR02757 family protein [Chitinophagales bacterium]